MTDHPNFSSSPRWGPTTKLVVGLTFAAIFAVLVISFRAILGPVLMALILSYLFYPIAAAIRRFLHIPWRVTVGLFYLFILIIILGLLAWGGIFLVDQIQSLVGFIQSALNDFPGFVTHLLSQPITIGPWVLDLNQISINNITNVLNPLLGLVQPGLSQVGSLVGTLATSFASILGWTIFCLLLSYFITSETEGNPGRIVNIQIPGYREDINRLGHELTIIWNAFLRGQMIVFFLVTAVYSILLTILGVHFFFGLALLAGLARFVPYIGGIISWTANGLVALSQGSTIFGLSPAGYALTVVIFGWVTDAVMDNLISPRIFSNALKIHPAAVMVAALVAFNVWGIIGVVLAAPTLATLKLFMDYTVRKMLDLDPWSGIVRMTPPPPLHITIRRNIEQAWAFTRLHSLRLYRWLLSLRKPQT
jgi:predicted PurR-regulated permease PerM